ncbi:MAG: glycosyltransferase family 39 protein, partial [Elusimicrobiales bacterium]|nr:glycosyltransferase family 39 protein [Elusimicrobiales bacterium]
EDMAFTAFSFLTVFFYCRYHRGRGAADLILTGAALGLALNSKHTALLLPPALAAHCLLDWLPRRDRAGELRRSCLALGAVLLTALLVLLPFYGPERLAYFFSGLKKTRALVAGGNVSYLNGAFSMTGFWNYFLYAILFKTPLPTLAFAALAAAARVKQRVLAGQDGLYLALFPALLLAAASCSDFHIGLRHVLPFFPFLFVFSGGAATFFGSRKTLLPAAALLLWQALAAYNAHPHYLAYFNELAGGTERGHERLLDSNLDWGQDLKGLKRYLEAERVSDLVLSYFGSTLPSYVGRDFQDLFSGVVGGSAHLNSLAPEREYLAVSATNLHGVYFREFGKDMFYWLKDRRPRAVIGGNMRVYDITADARAHEHLANVYFLTGYPRQAQRECRRALLLDPKARAAGFILALTLLKEPASEREGLALLRAWLRANAWAAPAEMPEFLPAPLFRYRYFLMARRAEARFRAANAPREAAAMAAFAQSLK